MVRARWFALVTLVSVVSPAGAATFSWVGGVFTNAWSVSTNWNPTGIPNQPFVTVDIGNPFAVANPSVLADGDYSIASFDLTGNRIYLRGGDSLSVYGGTCNLAAGSISAAVWVGIPVPAAAAAALDFLGPTTLAGSGTIEFRRNTSGAIDRIGGVGPLVTEAGISVQSAIGASNGTISVPLTNGGPVLADGGLIHLTADVTNQNLIEARNGGTIQLSNLAIDNTLGELRTDATSTVMLETVAVTGGWLRGDGAGGDFQASGVNELDQAALGAAATVTVDNDSCITVDQGLDNGGTIVLQDTTAAGTADVVLRGTGLDPNVRFTGVGTLVMGASPSSQTNKVVAHAATLDAILDLSSGQTVTTTTGGEGFVYTPIRSDGVVEARDGRLDLYEDVTNEGVVRADLNGTLMLHGLTVHNTTGQIEVTGGSGVTLDGSTLDGGIVTGGGSLILSSAGGTLDGTSLTLNGVSVDVSTAQRLTVATPTLINDGVLVLADTSGAGSAELFVDGPTMLDGSGTIRIDSPYTNRLGAVTAGDMLTLGPAQLLLGNGVGTAGDVEVALRNQGEVRADGGTLRLESEPKINDNLLTAVNGGTLAISTDVTNNGVITVDPTSTVDAAGPVVTGGTIDGGGLVTIGAAAVRFEGPMTLSGVTVDLTTARRLTLAGSVLSNADLTLTDTSGAGSAELYVDGSVDLSGSGTIRFSSGYNNFIRGVAPTDVLTLEPSHIVHTSGAGALGQIVAAISNQGLVAADGGTIRLLTNPKVNDGTLAASGGGTLDVRTAVTNGGSIVIDPTSTLYLHGATITGGVVNGGGLVDVGTNDATLDGVGLAGVAVAIGNAERVTLQNGVTLDGAMTLTDTSGAGSAELFVDGTQSMLGSGSVTFASNYANTITAAAPGDVLTLGPLQLIHTGGAATKGVVSAALVNQGSIDADGGTIQLDTNPKVNAGSISATAGGVIDLRTAVTSSGTITIDPASTLSLDGGAISGGTVDGGGTVDVTTLDGGVDNVVLSNVMVAVGNGDRVTLGGSVTLDGTVTLADNSGAGSAELFVNGTQTLLGAGTVRADSAFTNRVGATGAGATFILGPALTLDVTAGSIGRFNSDVTNQGHVIVDGVLVRESTAMLANDGSGVISGSGTLNLGASTLVNMGTIAPGSSPGKLSVTGAITNAATSVLAIELGGFLAGTEHDQLVVSGAVALDGAVAVSRVAPFAPVPGDQFVILEYGSRTGTFGSIQDLTGLPGLTFTVVYDDPAGEARLVVGGGAGEVGVGGSAPLLVAKSGSDVALSWGTSCSGGAVDYTIHEGVVGSWYSHQSIQCTTGGALQATVTPAAGVTYYLVVPRTAGEEGSYGDGSAGPRPPSSNGCLPQGLGSCGP